MMKISWTEPPAGRRAAVAARQGSRRLVGTPWRAQEVRTSIVHRYGTVEPDESRHAKTGFQRKPDMARRAPTDQSTVPFGVQMIYGTIRAPDGTQHAGPNPTYHA